MPTTHPERVAGLSEEAGDDDDDADYGMDAEPARSYSGIVSSAQRSEPRKKRSPVEIQAQKKAVEKRRRDRVASRNRYDKNQ